MMWIFAAVLAFAGPNPPGSVRYALAETPSLRFADAEIAGPLLAAGEMVFVVCEDGTRLRVRRGNTYGWIEANAVTEEAPAVAAPEIDLSGIDLSKLNLPPKTP